MKRTLQLGLAATFSLIGISPIANATESPQVETGLPVKQEGSSSEQVLWTPLEPEPSTAPKQPQWQKLTENQDRVLPESVVWTPVEPSVSADIEEKIEEEAPIQDPTNTAIAIRPPVMPSGTTFANDKAIWRDETWHPQISSMVPIGFGPQGVMASIGLSGIDCTASGICSQPKDWDEYEKQIQDFGEAQFDGSFAFGDSEKYVGLVITGAFEETTLPFGERNTNEQKNIFSNYYLGAHLSRNIGTDTALRIGIKNWLDVKECGLSCGFPKSAYGVISQRFRLKEDQNTWLPNAYLTLGVGNGEFRPLDEQVRSSIAAQRAADCQTYGYIPDKPCTGSSLRRAVLDAANYGEFTPIGAAALEVYPGFNAIGEWSGRNLNLGFSIRPFEEFGLVFTTMWNNLLQNCDYGCDIDVPDNADPVALPDNLITFRPVWSFKLSLDMKF